MLTHLLEEATTYQKELLPYGFTEAVNAPLIAAIAVIAAFGGTVGSTKGLLNTATGTHDTVDTQLKNVMQQCYELDDAMKIFEVLDPDLLRDYRQARRVGKSGGGKGPDAGTKPGPAA